MGFGSTTRNISLGGNLDKFFGFSICQSAFGFVYL